MPTPDAPPDRPASEPRHGVETVWDARITARDGVELSANLWLPRPMPGASGPDRFPAILEMIPYGKDSWRRNADVGRGTWFAQRGYAFCRLDVRGTGSSGGVALDEYTEAETLDGFDAVEWLAAQPWCDGAVGDVGHQLRRVHGHPGREAPAAAPAGDRAGPGHRRSVPDRRPLRRRVRHGQRAEPVRGQPDRHERDAARSGLPRTGVARRVAGPTRRDAAVAVRVAPPAARRAVLAAGLARAGL